MLLIGCFANTLELEQALADIERSGIERKHIMAVGMERPLRQAGESGDAVELGIAWATAFAVVGAATGFGLAWGPIVWGIVGAAAGFGIGYGFRRLARRGAPRFGDRAPGPELTVIVQCPAQLAEPIRALMYRSGALSVGASDG